MLNLLWNPLSISYLVKLILVLMMTGYFSIRIRNDAKSDKSLGINGALLVTFAALFVNMVMQFLRVSVHPDYTAYLLAWISPMGAIALCGFIQFAYRFSMPDAQGSRESHIVFTVSIAFVGLEVITAFLRHEALLTHGVVTHRMAWMNLPYIIGFLYAFLAFFRQMIRAISKDPAQSLNQSIGRGRVVLLGPSKPLNSTAAAARAFLIVCTFPLLFGMVFLLRRFDIIGPIMAELAGCWVFLLTLSSFGFVYLNYVPARTSYGIKLAGITLTIMLSILCGVAWIIGPIYADAYQNQHLVKARTALRFDPMPTGGYAAARTSYRFETQIGERLGEGPETIALPFAFPYFETIYKQIHVRLDGLVGFEYAPFWRDVSHRFGPQPALYPLAMSFDDLANGGVQTPRNQHRGLFVKREAGRVVVTWRRLTAPSRPDSEYTFQMILYPDGAIEFHYMDLPEDLKPDFFISTATPMMVGITPGNMVGSVEVVGLTSDLLLSGVAGAGLMENYRLDFLLYLDKIYAPIAFFIMGTSLFVLLAFPVFFQTILDRPLARLLDGVRAFRSGEFSVAIPVVYRDEIGFLTQSINEMAYDQKSRINILENKMAQRSVEAAQFSTENIQHEERNHLSGELHDAVSQTLFSASLIADTLPNLWRHNPKRAKKALDEMRQLNRRALSEMRQLLFELRSPKIFTRTLGSLLREFSQKFEDQRQVHVKLNVESDKILPGKVQIAFYRIAQECLNNIAKHTDATEISLRFDGMATQAMMEITDNGQGLALHDMPIGHMGLQIMQERIEEIGGSLEIKTAPDEGTSLTVIWFKNDAN